METHLIDIKKVLVRQLERNGVELSTIPHIIRDLANSFFENPAINLFQANNRLNLLGWSDISCWKVEIARSKKPAAE